MKIHTTDTTIAATEDSHNNSKHNNESNPLLSRFKDMACIATALSALTFSGCSESTTEKLNRLNRPAISSVTDDPEAWVGKEIGLVGKPTFVKDISYQSKEMGMSTQFNTGSEVSVVPSLREVNHPQYWYSINNNGDTLYLFSREKLSSDTDAVIGHVRMLNDETIYLYVTGSVINK